MRIILLGPPGAGKGTVAKKLQKELDIPVISTGVILRKAITKKTELGEKVESIMSEGELVPDFLIMEIIKERIKEKDCEKGYIFDGFPRNIKQANSLERLNKELFMKIDFVFYFEISDAKIIQRLSSRRVCKKCGCNYNLIFNPPKKDNLCDLCGATLYQRDDDKEDIVKNRIKVYNQQTLPLKIFYKEKKLLKVVDASVSENEFFLNIKKIISN